MRKTTDRDFNDGDIRLAYNQRGYGKEREKVCPIESNHGVLEAMKNELRESVNFPQ